MAVRLFNGTTDALTCATGALATSTFGTVAAIVRRGAIAEWQTALGLHTSGGSGTLLFGYSATNASVLYTGGESSGPTAPDSTAWRLVVVRKASGAAAPRWSVYNFTTGTWTHAAGATLGNWTAPGAGGSIRFNYGGADPFDGRIAVRAAWNTVRWSADTTGDAAIAAAGLEDTLQAWLDASPSALWRFDQAAVTTSVLDLTGGGANQTARTGTTVVTGDDPPGFSFVTATDFYIAANGSDANPGTLASPWLTFNNLYTTTFGPGDTINLRGGDTFTGLLYLSGTGGTSTEPIRVRSYGTGRATITNTTNSGVYVQDAAWVELDNIDVVGGAGATAYDGISWFTSTSQKQHVRISNVTVSGWRNGVVVGGDTGGGWNDVTIEDVDAHNNRDQGIFTYGPAGTIANTDVTVRSCRAWDNEGNAANVTTNSGSGILLGSVQNGLVEYCSAWSNGALCTAPEGPVGIWCYDADAVTIQYCVAYDNHTGGTADGDGFDLDIRTTNSVVQYCLAYGNDGAGILVYGGDATAHSGNTVRYNLCWGNSTGSDFYYGEITLGGNVGNVQVFHNTCVARDNGAVQPAAFTVPASGASGATVRNNVLRGATGPVVMTDTAYATAAVLFQGNAYEGAGGIDWGGTTYSTVAAWRTTTTQERLSGADVGYVGTVGLVSPGTAPTVTDPAAVGTGADGLKLAAGSAVAGAGLNLPVLFGTALGTRDYFGTAPTAPYSIGGHEQNQITGAGAARGGATAVSGSGATRIAVAGAATTGRARVSGTAVTGTVGSGAARGGASQTAGSAAVTATGSGSGSAARPVVAGAATARVSVSGAVRVGAGALTGLGLTRAAASGQARPAPAAAAGSGTESVAAAGSSTVPPGSVSGSGIVGVSGAGTVRSAATVTVGAGSVVLAGVGATRVAPARAVGSGGVTPAGSGTVTAAASVAAGAVQAPTVAAGATRADTAGLSGFGSVEVAGDGSASSRAGLVVGSGAAEQPEGSGSGVAVIGPARVSGAGRAEAAAAGAAAVPAAGAVGGGQVRAAAVGALSPSRSLVLGAGKVTIAGAAGLTAALPVVSGSGAVGDSAIGGGGAASVFAGVAAGVGAAAVSVAGQAGPSPVRLSGAGQGRIAGGGALSAAAPRVSSGAPGVPAGWVPQVSGPFVEPVVLVSGPHLGPVVMVAGPFTEPLLAVSGPLHDPAVAVSGPVSEPLVLAAVP